MVIAHNIRSVHNVGSILRTADGLGVAKVYLTGYTPYPAQPDDPRPPHIRDKLTKQLHKTALGAEQTVATEYYERPITLIQKLKKQGYLLIGLEQAASSVDIRSYQPKSSRLALLLGEEVHGITAELLKLCDDVIEIPMLGHKESLNVSVAAGISIYELSKSRL